MATTQPIRSIEKLELFKKYYRECKKNYRNYLLIILGLNSALRISDLLHLNYGDVYDYKNQVWKTHLVVKEQKTGKTNRILINKELIQALKDYSSYTIHQAEDWIIQSQMSDTKPLSRYQAFRIIKEAASYAGLEENISCHSLRKTFGYHAWKRGTPPVLLMELYNHSSFLITKRYLCIDQDDKDMVFRDIQL